MTSKKTIKKVLYSLVITILVLVSGLATLILYPQPLFANKVEYKQFNVYSNEKIDNEVKSILDTALSLVGNSELYDSAYEVDIFFSYNTFFNQVDDKLFGYGPAARAIDNNLVFKVVVDIKKNLAYATSPKPCLRHIDYAIAHEMTHCLQAHKYGILKFNPFKHPEMWKLEGYPEYVARHKFSSSPNDLKEEIERFRELKYKQTHNLFLEDEGGCDVPEYYYKGMLMIEYLINVRHLTYDQILKDTRPEEEIYTEITAWADRQREENSK